MQKKLLSTLIASAFAGAAGVAVAGPISVGTVNTYASEGLANATNVSVANVAYQLTNPIAANSVNTFTYALDAGVSGATPATAANCPALANPGTGAFGATKISTDGKTCSYPYTNSATPISANTVLSFTAGSTDGVAALASTGKVTATVNVLDSTGTGVSGEGNNATVALAANAFTIVPAINSATFTKANSGQSLVESSRLDVTVSPSASAFTNEADVTASTTVIDVGAVRLTDAAGRLGPDANPFNLTTVTSESLVITVGGPFVNGAKVSLSSTADCTAPIAAPVTIASGAQTAKFTIVPVTTTGTPYLAFACYTAPATATTMNPGQFTLAATYDSKYAGLDNTTVTLPTGNVYLLNLNGVQIDIRNHIPTSVTGWTNAYRIINTGAVTASFSAQYIDVNGNPVGTAQVIAAGVPAGGTVVVSVPQVEAALGAAPAGAPAGVGPRLRVTAPTDSARIQVYGVQPNGSIFTNSDAQGADSGGTDK